jgi:hypothetical protein
MYLKLISLIEWFTRRWYDRGQRSPPDQSRSCTVKVAADGPWLWLVEGARPDRWDGIGAAICLTRATLILWGPSTGRRNAGPADPNTPRCRRTDWI